MIFLYLLLLYSCSFCYFMLLLKLLVYSFIIIIHERRYISIVKWSNEKLIHHTIELNYEWSLIYTTNIYITIGLMIYLSGVCSYYYYIMMVYNTRWPVLKNGKAHEVRSNRQVHFYRTRLMFLFIHVWVIISNLFINFFIWVTAMLFNNRVITFCV